MKGSLRIFKQKARNLDGDSVQYCPCLCGYYCSATISMICFTKQTQCAHPLQILLAPLWPEDSNSTCEPHQSVNRATPELRFRQFLVVRGVLHRVPAATKSAKNKIKKEEHHVYSYLSATLCRPCVRASKFSGTRKINSESGMTREKNTFSYICEGKKENRQEEEESVRDDKETEMAPTICATRVIIICNA